MSGLSKPIGNYPVAELPAPPPAGAEGEPAVAATSAEPAPAAARAEPARLDFVGTLGTTVQLAFPFRLDGLVVDAVTVRRLTVAEVRDAAEAMLERADPNLYAFYSPMTGLPEAVLLGLIEEDGDAVIEACQRFLPRLARQVFSAPTSGSGAATPSSPPEG